MILATIKYLAGPELRTRGHVFGTREEAWEWIDQVSQAFQHSHNTMVTYEVRDA